MKLYATVTSERASKGQGGEYLNIVITESDKREVARLVVREGVIQYDYDEDSTAFERVHELELKGEKQKGKNERCLMHGVRDCAECYGWVFSR